MASRPLGGIGGAAAGAGPASGIRDDGKLFSVVVFYRPPAPATEFAKVFKLAEAYEVSSFSFLYRKNLREYLTFSSRALSQRTPSGCRNAVKYQDSIGYCMTR